MYVEQYEILVRQHYHLSTSLLEQMEQGIERAVSEEARRGAEARYRQLLQLHRRVEEQFRTYWQGGENDGAVFEDDGSDPF